MCDKIYDITPHFDTPTFPNQYICDWDYGKDFHCLSFEELTSYLNGKQGYGWHISDLKIYDKPRELGEFKPIYKYNMDCKCVYWDDCKHKAITTDWGYPANMCNKKITRPPQSWMYVDV